VDTFIVEQAKCLWSELKPETMEEEVRTSEMA
jgi:hypothetical protein